MSSGTGSKAKGKGTANNMQKNGVVGKIPAVKDCYHVTLMFFISLLAWPIVFVFNNAFTSIEASVRPFWMMASGFLILLAVSVLAFKASKIKDWLFFGITVFAFSSVIDLIITLEFLGLIKNFMSEYLKMGEPYLFSSWGSAICIFDGIGFYTMYHFIVYFYSNGKSWRSVGLYWASGILNSMIVLMVGIFIGFYPATFCTFLNLPYIIFPIIVLLRIFGKENRSGWNVSIKSSLLTKLFDIVLVIGFVVSIWLTIAKALTALGSNLWIAKETTRSEKALLLADPAPFAVLQVLVFFFYILPAQITSLYYLLRKEKPQFLWETTVIHAGAMLQAQFSYILYSIDHGTPSKFRVDWTDSQFWFVNLIVLLVPHLFLVRLYFHRKTTGSLKKIK